MRPVIIFEEISHVTRGRKGVFICNRNLYSLEKTINYIKNNYSIIIKEMKKNTLPTKKSFINELTNIIFKN